MKVKRYVVREMQEAIRLIKQDLGPEAVIVSSYKVPAKGLAGFFSPRLLEVTAALDEAAGYGPRYGGHVPHVLAGSPARRLKPAGNKVAGMLGGCHPAPAQLKERFLSLAGGKSGPGARSAAGGGLQGDDMGRVQGTRQQRHQLPGGNDNGGNIFQMMINKHMYPHCNGDFLHNWRQKLLDMELQESLVEHILGAVKNPGYPELTDGQQAHFEVFKQVVNLLEPAYKNGRKARIMTFVGPSGSGKTTTLAKLAARASLYGRKNIALIAVCNYRIGSVEPLRAYSGFLGVPVDVVMTPDELARAVESHADKDLIYIDTTGRPALNSGQVLELKGFLETVREPQDICLVLSTASKNRDLTRTAYGFLKLGYNKLIFTKVDETGTHGSIVNLVCALRKPVAYVAGGQGIPDDISEAGPKKIAELLLRGAEPDECVFN